MSPPGRQARGRAGRAGHGVRWETFQLQSAAGPAPGREGEAARPLHRHPRRRCAGFFIWKGGKNQQRREISEAGQAQVPAQHGAGHATGAPSPQMSLPPGLRLGARLQPRSAPGFVSSTSPCENRHHLFGGGRGGAGGAGSPGRARRARAVRAGGSDTARTGDGSLQLGIPSPWAFQSIQQADGWEPAGGRASLPGRTPVSAGAVTPRSLREQQPRAQGGNRRGRPAPLPPSWENTSKGSCS